MRPIGANGAIGTAPDDRSARRRALPIDVANCSAGVGSAVPCPCRHMTPAFLNEHHRVDDELLGLVAKLTEYLWPGIRAVVFGHVDRNGLNEPVSASLHV